MSREDFYVWERAMRKKCRRWLTRPIWTFPWDVQPGKYLPPAAPPRSSDEIKALRNSEELSQRELAAFLNVSPKTVQSWEQGVRQPDGASLRMLQMLDELGKLMLFQACWQPGVDDDALDEDDD